MNEPTVTFATPVQKQDTSGWERWTHACGFILLMRLHYNGVSEQPQWRDDFEDADVTDCPRCKARLNMRDGR